MNQLISQSKMPATKRAKAQELISQFEQHQHGQIQCLQALLDFAEGGEVVEEVKGMHAYIAGLPVC